MSETEVSPILDNNNQNYWDGKSGKISRALNEMCDTNLFMLVFPADAHPHHTDDTKSCFKTQNEPVFGRYMMQWVFALFFKQMGATKLNHSITVDDFVWIKKNMYLP